MTHSPGLWRTALILALLSAIGPFAIDMYLPALPAIREGLATDEQAVQRTLILYFVAFGLIQIVYGPLADRFGRKPPLIAGVVLFIAGSVACALAPDIGWLTAARFVQGLGAAAVMVIPRAVIRDMHTGAEATRLMALIMLITSVSPMLAPLAGSAMLALGDWRLVFWALAVAGVASVAITALALPETLPPAARQPFSARALWRGAGVLLRDGPFIGLTLVGAFGFGSFFVFISAGAFVYTQDFGLSPTGFSIAFAINALGFFIASQFAAPLGQRFGMVPVMRVALYGFALATGLLFLVALAGGATLVVVVVLLCLGNACLGLVIPASMVMALDPHGALAGLASSLGGMLQMLVGGLIVTLAGPFFDGTALPMTGAIFACAAFALGTALWVLPRVRAVPA